MSVILRTSLLICILFYFMIILLLLKHKALELKYTLLWLAAGIMMALLVAFPDLLEMVIHLLGIETYMYGLFVICIAFIICILMALTSIVSRQLGKIQSLAQECAMLENRLRKLEGESMNENSFDNGGSRLYWKTCC